MDYNNGDVVLVLVDARQRKWTHAVVIRVAHRDSGDLYTVAPLPNGAPGLCVESPMVAAPRQGFKLDLVSKAIDGFAMGKPLPVAPDELGEVYDKMAAEGHARLGPYSLAFERAALDGDPATVWYDEACKLYWKSPS